MKLNKPGRPMHHTNIYVNAVWIQNDSICVYDISHKKRLKIKDGRKFLLQKKIEIPIDKIDEIQDKNNIGSINPPNTNESLDNIKDQGNNNENKNKNDKKEIPVNFSKNFETRFFNFSDQDIYDDSFDCSDYDSFS